MTEIIGWILPSCRRTKRGLSVSGRNLCKVDGCKKPVIVKRSGLCGKHYARLLRHGDPLKLKRAENGSRKTECKIDGCHVKVKARGFCEKHYTRWRRNGDPSLLLRLPPGANVGQTCSVTGCKKPVKSRGYCETHYQRWRVTGTTGTRIKRGCKVPGCDRKHDSWGFCLKHYKQYRIGKLQYREGEWIVLSKKEMHKLNKMNETQ